MKLIGMLDSPFVRRTAIGLDLLGFSFEHQSLSVFRDFDSFRQQSPLVKAPSLILDDGTVLVDSNLILQYAERIAPHSLISDDPKIMSRQFQIMAVSSIANEKTVQLVYEDNVRPEEKRHQPWIDRVDTQLQSTFEQLELLVSDCPELFNTEALNHASVAAAISWFFVQNMRPGAIAADGYPALAEWSRQAETTEVFQRYPYDFSMS